jgi:response regulator RpfG family c-di-GMP phosphodiesterase
MCVPSAVGRPEAIHTAGIKADKAPQQRVLIVDDEDNILSALRRLLRREPYDLITVNNAQDALRVLESRSVSVLIADYRMPRMTGTELLLEVQRRWPETLRIVLSGYSEVSAIISAINEGAVYKFITKPWNDEEIKLHIRRALEQHALEAENRRLAHEITVQNQQLVELNEQLDQRAADASRGLTFAQEILEVLDVGVLTIDATGLIVNVNRQAVQFLACAAGGLLGVLAQAALPETFYQQVCAPANSRESGRLSLNGRSLQWRGKQLLDVGGSHGVVIVIWEDV